MRHERPAALPRRARIAPAFRRLTARHPSLRWIVIGALALSAGLVTQHLLDGVVEARGEWERIITVAVADGDHRAGDPLRTVALDVPAVAVPPGAIDPDADIAGRVVQSVGDREIVVVSDVTVATGPAALAPDGSVVVAIADPLTTSVPPGVSVDVYAEGVVLAEDGVAVGGGDGTVLIAVDVGDAPSVAAAAATRTATLAFPARR